MGERRKMKAWFRRHKFITWAIVFGLINLIDLPIRFYTQWFWVQDISRIEFWFDSLIGVFFMFLAWIIADYVKGKL